MKKALPPYLHAPEIADESAYYCNYDPLVSWPRISIVTPSFNQGQYIETTIRSLILQGYPNLQYIIMDGGSSDSTLEVINHYAEHIDVWVSEKDHGQSHAINKGLAVVDGDIFNWINSDDWLEPKALHTIAELFIKHNALAVGTRCNLLRSGKLEWVGGGTKKNATWMESAWERGLNQQGLFFNVDCLKQLNGVDERYHFSMDLDLWVRFLITFGQSRYISYDAVTSNFRLHDDCKSTDGWGPGSPSDIETKAMYFRLARTLNDQRYFPALKILFPEYKQDLANMPIHSDISLKNIGEWLNFGLFKEMKKAYYTEDFNRAILLGDSIDPRYLDKSAAIDHASFLRYSHMHGSALGRLAKKILKR